MLRGSEELCLLREEYYLSLAVAYHRRPAPAYHVNGQVSHALWHRDSLPEYLKLVAPTSQEVAVGGWVSFRVSGFRF